jgi:hypothetical protein
MKMIKKLLDNQFFLKIRPLLRYMMQMYKDHIKGRHKIVAYKKKDAQVILSTAVALSIGLTSFSSVSSVFADEKAKDSQKQIQGVLSPPVPVAGSINMDQVIQIASDGTVKIINDQVLPQDAWFKQTLAKMGGMGLIDAAKAAHNNGTMSVNDFARDMVMVGTSLVPYGGALISPLIGLLWPPSVEAQQNAMKKLMEQISEMMDEKINDYDYESLKTDITAVVNELHKLEVGLQGQNLASFFSNGDIQESNRNQAQIVNAAFRKVIENCKKDKHKKSELPLYTIAAAAHLQFLSFMVVNGEGPKLLIDKDSLKKYYKDDLENAISEYDKYIKETGAEGAKDLNNVNNDLGNATNKLSKLSSEYSRLMSKGGLAAGSAQMLKPALDEITGIVKQLTDKQKKYSEYVRSTIESEAFKKSLEFAKDPRKADTNQKTENVNSDKIPDGTYEVTNASDNKFALDLNAKNNNVTLWKEHGGQNQKWKLAYKPDHSAYQLENAEGGKVLTWDCSYTTNNVIAQRNENKDEQFWIIESVGNSEYVLKNKKDQNKFLDLASAASEGANVVVLHEDKESKEQKFKFKKV